MLVLLMNFLTSHGCFLYISSLIYLLVLLNLRPLWNINSLAKFETIQSDGGSEYSKTQFQDYLTSHGILSCISCPHTPQQNGISERKHRHIVETGLALLAQSNLHTKYWIDAFNTAVYLINRLPTPVLRNVSPYATLLHVEPNYSFLKVFRCFCFPLLRPYNAHKLLFQSKKMHFYGL